MRIFLSCVNVIQLFRRFAGELGIKNNKHHEICKTYTILDKDKAEIISKLSKDF